ncbi:MAG: hypothetical protein JF618_00855 [Leifsonia sp.]|nr:hypothetical protein [Leifsonia sp.]
MSTPARKVTTITISPQSASRWPTSAARAARSTRMLTTTRPIAIRMCRITMIVSTTMTKVLSGSPMRLAAMPSRY